MGSTYRSIAILSVIAALLLAPSIAVGAVDLEYSGETPTSGMDSYSGANFSDSLWDYVYDLSDTHWRGPNYWGIRTFDGTEVEADAIYAPAPEENVGGWSGVWDDNVVNGEYFGVFDGSELEGHSAVVWSWSGVAYATPHTGTFHFASRHEPWAYDWAARGYTDEWCADGTEWSANPEPASMLLTSMALLGVAYWRRRKTG